MPLYFIDTFDNIVAFDDVGHDLPDEQAVRKVVRETLVGMLAAEHGDRPSAQYRAEVRDEAGQPLLTGTVLIVMDKPPRYATEPPGNVVRPTFTSHQRKTTQKP